MADPITMAGITDRHQIISAGGYFRDKRYDYTSGNLDYTGFHEIHDASVDDTKWLVWKHTWSGSDQVRVEGPKEGAWSNRASLSWGS